MTKTVMITSFKGGVGKSTVSANLALGLALSGKKTVLIDCDFRMRCLDILLGCEDRVLYTVNDALQGRTEIDDVFLKDVRTDELLFCPAPYNFRGGIDGKQLQKVIGDIKEKVSPDFIILDTPGSSGRDLKEIASVCDCAYIVANHSFTSVRAAESTGDELEDFGIEEKYLIVNMFDLYGKNATGKNILEVIDRTRLRLIGIIPRDSEFSEKQDNGLLFDSMKKKNVAKAFENTVDRINGKNVPLFTGFRKIKRNKILNG